MTTNDKLLNGSGLSTVLGLVKNKIDLKQEAPLIGTTSTLTPTQVANAMSAGKDVFIETTQQFLQFQETFLMKFNAYGEVVSNMVGASGLFKYGDSVYAMQLTGWLSDDTWSWEVTEVAKASDVPTNISTLTNDSGYITSSALTPYVPITVTAGSVGNRIISQAWNGNYNNADLSLYSGNTSKSARVRIYSDYERNQTSSGVSIIGDNISLSSGASTITVSGSRGISIVGVTTPTSDTMAANKKYVDDQITGITSSIIEPIQSDWNQSVTTSLDFIKNKPTALSDFNNDVGFITAGDLTTGITYELSSSGPTVTLLGSNNSASTVTVSGFMADTHPASVITSTDIENWNGITTVDNLYVNKRSTGNVTLLDEQTYTFTNTISNDSHGINSKAHYADENYNQVIDSEIDVDYSGFSVSTAHSVGRLGTTILYSSGISGEYDNVSIVSVDNTLQSSATGAPHEGNSVNILSDNVSITAITDTVAGVAGNGYIDISGATVSILGVITPTSDTMAANKKYVDDAIVGVTTVALASYVPITTTNDNIKTQFLTQSSTTGMTLRISDGNPATHQALLKMESTNESYPKTSAQLLADNILIQATTLTLSGVKTPTSNTDAANKKYVDDKVSTAIGSIVGISFETGYTTYADLVEDDGDVGVIYLIPNSGSTPNIYDEYIWTGSDYEKIGTTEVDLSNYVQTSGLTPYLQKSEISVSQGITTGVTVGTVTLDGTTTTLYAPSASEGFHKVVLTESSGSYSITSSGDTFASIKQRLDNNQVVYVTISGSPTIYHINSIDSSELTFRNISNTEWKNISITSSAVTVTDISISNTENILEIK